MCSNWRAFVRMSLAGLIVSCGACAWVSAQEGSGSSNPEPDTVRAQDRLRAVNSSDLQDYEISPDDLLRVYVFDVPEISREYRVSPTGQIRLALVPDPVPAAGLTPSELSDAISNRLRASRLVTHPKVSIEIAESHLHSVAITGAVKKPQIYPVFGHTTFLDVLSQAEGLTEDAGATAIITRGSAGRHREQSRERVDAQSQEHSAENTTVDLQRLLQSGGAGSNPFLYPGDRVTVPRAGVFYVLGAVNRPGGYNLHDAQEQVTVLMALAAAGDMGSTAKRDNVVLIRKNSNGREEIPVKVSAIMSGHAPDPKMRANDVLVVPDSRGKRAARSALTAVGAIATTATAGVIIYRR